MCGIAGYSLTRSSRLDRTLAAQALLAGIAERGADAVGCARVEPGMSVDSEAIFALAAHSHADPRALEALRGSMATAWLDEREQSTLYLARGVGRPLWLGRGREGTFFASTRLALEVVEQFLRLKLHKTELDEGTFVALKHGAIADKERFRPDEAFEDEPLPAVRAPKEGAFCLSRLATLVATAS